MVRESPALHRAEPFSSVWSEESRQVSVLAHDFGKTFSGPGFSERHHDKLTLSALAPILDVLRHSHPQFVDDLKLIFCLRQENRRPKDISRWMLRNSTSWVCYAVLERLKSGGETLCIERELVGF
jgi:hypothetical protein